MTDKKKPWVLEVSAVEWPPNGFSEGDIVRGAYGYSVRVLRVLDPLAFDGARLLVEEVVAAA